jgi:hypothetical protein
MIKHRELCCGGIGWKYFCPHLRSPDSRRLLELETIIYISVHFNGFDTKSFFNCTINCVLFLPTNIFSVCKAYSEPLSRVPSLRTRGRRFRRSGDPYAIVLPSTDNRVHAVDTRHKQQQYLEFGEVKTRRSLLLASAKESEAPGPTAEAGIRFLKRLPSDDGSRCGIGREEPAGGEIVVLLVVTFFAKYHKNLDRFNLFTRKNKNPSRVLERLDKSTENFGINCSRSKFPGTVAKIYIERISLAPNSRDLF